MPETSWQSALLAWNEELIAIGRPPTTRYLRTYHVRKFAAAHQHLSIESIDREHIVKWFADHPDWAPSTRNSYRVSIRVFFQWAHRSKRITDNPAATLPAVVVPRAVPRPAPDEVVDAGLRHINLRVRLMISILAYTGIRRGELCKLHTGDVQRSFGGWSLRVVGKGGHERCIPISDSIAASIRMLPHGYVFPGGVDGHLSAGYVGKLVSRALDGPWTAHTIRHRYASLAYSVERDIRAVQELLGHAKITTTQIYTFVPSDSLRRAAAGAALGLTA